MKLKPLCFFIRADDATAKKGAMFVPKGTVGHNRRSDWPFLRSALMPLWACADARRLVLEWGRAVKRLLQIINLRTSERIRLRLTDPPERCPYRLDRRCPLLLRMCGRSRDRRVRDSSHSLRCSPLTVGGSTAALPIDRRRLVSVRLVLEITRHKKGCRVDFTRTPTSRPAVKRDQLSQ